MVSITAIVIDSISVILIIPAVGYIHGDAPGSRDCNGSAFYDNRSCIVLHIDQNHF